MIKKPFVGDNRYKRGGRVFFELTVAMMITATSTRSIIVIAWWCYFPPRRSPCGYSTARRSEYAVSHDGNFLLLFACCSVVVSRRKHVRTVTTLLVIMQI